MHGRGSCEWHPDLKEGPDCFSAKTVEMERQEVVSQNDTSSEPRIPLDCQCERSINNLAGKMSILVTGCVWFCARTTHLRITHIDQVGSVGNCREHEEGENNNRDPA
jgi:hypothetical protein